MQTNNSCHLKVDLLTDVRIMKCLQYTWLINEKNPFKKDLFSGFSARNLQTSSLPPYINFSLSQWILELYFPYLICSPKKFKPFSHWPSFGIFKKPGNKKHCTKQRQRYGEVGSAPQGCGVSHHFGCL